MGEGRLRKISQRKEGDTLMKKKFFDGVVYATGALVAYATLYLAMNGAKILYLYIQIGVMSRLAGG